MWELAHYATTFIHVGTDTLRSMYSTQVVCCAARDGNPCHKMWKPAQAIARCNAKVRRSGSQVQREKEERRKKSHVGGGGR